MTYSRPSTSTVNALDLPTPYQPLGAPGRQEVSVTGNGRFLDYTNPAQAGKNAGQDAAAVGTFLQGIIKPGAEIYKGYLEGQASQQVGKFLQTVDVESLYRAGNEDQRNMLRSLNPFAQDAVQQAAAKGSLRTYFESLSVIRSNDKTLVDPLATPAAVAQAGARAKAQAMEASGLRNLPPAVLAQYAPAMADAEAGLKADSYKILNGNKQLDDRQKLVVGFQTDLVTLTTNRRGALLALQNNKDDGPIKAGQFAVQDWGKANLEAFTKNGVYTPKETAEVFWDAMQAEVVRLRSTNDFEGAQSLLDTLIAGTSKPVPTKTGLDLWDIRLGGDNGPSVKTRLNMLQADLTPAMQAWEREQRVKSFGADMALAAQGDPGAVLRVTGRLGELAGDPAALREVMSTATQAQSFARTPTDAQLAEQERLTVQLNDPNRDRRGFAGVVNASGMTLEQKIRMQAANTQPTDPIIGLVSTAQNYAKDDLTQAASYIFQGMVKAGKYTGKMDSDSVGAKISEIALDLRVKAAKASEAGVKALMGSGKDVGSSDALSIYRDQLNKIRDAEFQKLKVDPPANRSPSTQVLNDFNFVQDKFYQTRGVPTIGVFPPSVIAASKAAGIPQDYRNVSKFFMTQLRAARSGDGKPLFPEPDKAWQEVIKQSKNRPQAPGQAPMPTSKPVGAWEPGPQSQGRGLFDMIYRTINPEPAPLPPKGKPGGGSSSKPGGTSPQARAQVQEKPSGNLGQQVVAKGLEILGNVIAPPANAAEFTAGQAGPARVARVPAVAVANPEAVAQLASLWAGRTAMGPATPALPQLVANMPAQAPSVAISSDTHPFFLAIGIAEGTRTAAGGYTRAYYGHTDPGNKVHNVGTVSGQQGGTPQSSDRRWMATLTQKQMQVAPLLQRLGVPVNSVAYNRLMFNALDLAVQAPLAYIDFIKKLPSVISQGMTIEAIAKARADSFINPQTGRLDAGGFGNSYSRLLADQRSRAGAFDYKRRL